MAQTNRNGLSFEAWLNAARWPWDGDLNRARDRWLSGEDPAEVLAGPVRMETRTGEGHVSQAAAAAAAPPENAPTHTTREAAEARLAGAEIGFHVVVGDEDRHVLIILGTYDGIRDARDSFRYDMPKRKHLAAVEADAKYACVYRVRRGRVVEKIEMWTRARTVWHRDGGDS